MKPRKKVLITGNLGYIGSVLSGYLIKKNFIVKGLDVGYFKKCNFNFYKNDKISQSIKDIRDVNFNDLKNVDIVVHLAGLSNDPLGELAKNITNEVNYKATVKLANLAKKSGVQRFIFTSSQSIYGISKISKELDEYKSIKNPITQYAKSKMKSEKYLLRINSPKFNVIIFRPSTVFGASNRFRSDIVFNNLMASGFVKNEIIINTDGKPWRPVIHVKDVCNALYAGIVAPSKKVNGQIYNLGILGGNYTVKQIALNAKKAMNNCKLKIINDHKDPRSYKVSFNKIYKDLKPYYAPKYTLKEGGKEILSFFKKIKFSNIHFKGQKTNRLVRLKYLIETKQINKKLRFNTK